MPSTSLAPLSPPFAPPREQVVAWAGCPVLSCFLSVVGTSGPHPPGTAAGLGSHEGSEWRVPTCSGPTRRTPRPRPRPRPPPRSLITLGLTISPEPGTSGAPETGKAWRRDLPEAGQVQADPAD